MAEAEFPDSEKLTAARDMFMFSFYTRGMSFVDMAYLEAGRYPGRCNLLSPPQDQTDLLGQGHPAGTGHPGTVTGRNARHGHCP